MFIINLDKIIIISIISVTVLIFCLFIAVNIRRLIKYMSYKRLDIAREKYEEILRPLLLNKVHIDYDTCYVNKKSVEWKAVEDVLFHAMAKGHATSEDITGVFERLGYIDTYIKDIVSGNRYNRALAAEKLGRLKAPQATEYIVKAMNDTARDVRTVAVRSLGNIRDVRAIEPLIDKFVQAAQDPHSLPLRVVKTSVMKYRNDALPLLIPLMGHSSWRVRGQAADVIGEIAEASAVVHLLPMLGDTEPDVRIKAVKALGNIRHEDAFQPLTGMIRDSSWIVRLQVAKTLGCMGGSEAVPPLVDLLSDLHWQVREAAVQAISSLGRMASPALLKVLLLMRDRYAREQVIAELQSTEILNSQFDMLCSADIKERETASLLLVAAGNSGAWSIIADAVREHENPCVRKRLIHVIKLIVNDDAENVLREVSDGDPDESVRDAARLVLEKTLCR